MRETLAFATMLVTVKYVKCITTAIWANITAHIWHFNLGFCHKDLKPTFQPNIRRSARLHAAILLIAWRSWLGNLDTLIGPAKPILQDCTERGRRRKKWENNTRKWTGLTFITSQTDKATEGSNRQEMPRSHQRRADHSFATGQREREKDGVIIRRIVATTDVLTAGPQ